MRLTLKNGNTITFSPSSGPAYSAYPLSLIDGEIVNREELESCGFLVSDAAIKAQKERLARSRGENPTEWTTFTSHDSWYKDMRPYRRKRWWPLALLISLALNLVWFCFWWGVA